MMPRGGGRERVCLMGLRAARRGRTGATGRIDSMVNICADGCRFWGGAFDLGIEGQR